MQDEESDGEFLALLENNLPLWRVEVATIGVLPDWTSDDWGLEGWFAHGPVCAAALHEAAHAAMGLRFGALPLAPSIGPQPGLGAVTWRAASAALRPRDQVCVMLAGLAAELLAGSDHPFANARRDVMRAIQLSLEPAAPDPRPVRARVDAALTDAWLDTLDMMAEPGMELAVRRLAIELLRHRQPPAQAWLAACRAAQDAMWETSQGELPFTPAARPRRRQLRPQGLAWPAARTADAAWPPPGPPRPATMPARPPPGSTLEHAGRWHPTLLRIAVLWGLWTALVLAVPGLFR